MIAVRSISLPNDVLFSGIPCAINIRIKPEHTKRHGKLHILLTPLAAPTLMRGMAYTTKYRSLCSKTLIRHTNAAAGKNKERMRTSRIVPRRERGSELRSFGR